MHHPRPPFHGLRRVVTEHPAPSDLQVAQKQLKTKDAKQDKGNVKIEKGKEVKETKSSDSKTKAKDQGKKQK